MPFLHFLRYRQKICFFNFDVKCALSGNRTPVSRVAGENSTTEPTMRVVKSKSNLSNQVKYLHSWQKSPALSGNRTPVSRVAGENSTTEPTMLERIYPSVTGRYIDVQKDIRAFQKNWPRWGSNPQSSDSKSDALSIGPRGRCKNGNIIVSCTTRRNLWSLNMDKGF